MDCSTAIDPDYTGVPLFQLRGVIARNLNGRSKFWLAEKTGISQKELARILSKAKPSAVLGLHKCDKLLSAMGQNISHIEQRGELNVVPLGASRANAIKMARDIFAITEESASEESVVGLAASLLRFKTQILRDAA